MPSSPRPWAPAVLLAVGLFATAALRAPFLDLPLSGEEGIFAMLAVDNGRPAPAARESIAVARAGGRDAWEAPQHPLPPYVFLIHAVRPLLAPEHFGALPLEQKSRLARWPFFALSIAAWICWLALAWKSAAGDASGWKLALAALLFANSAPLVVGASIQPQLDGSFGVLAVCVSALCLAFSNRSAAAGAGAGFAAALGKNEWALAFAAACALAWLAGRFFKTAPDASEQRAIPWAFAGLVAGTLLSAVLDWANYRDGFLLMFKFGLGTPQPWSTTFAQRLPWIWPLFPMLALAAWLFCSNRAHAANPAHRLLFFYGIALSAGYLATNWTSDFFPRYFAPPLFALCCYVALACASPGFRLHRAAATALPLLLCAGSIFHVYQLVQQRAQDRTLGSYPGTAASELSAAYPDYYARRAGYAARGELPVTNAAYGYYYPDADYTTRPDGTAPPPPER